MSVLKEYFHRMKEIRGEENKLLLSVEMNKSVGYRQKVPSDDDWATVRLTGHLRGTEERGPGDREKGAGG